MTFALVVVARNLKNVVGDKNGTQQNMAKNGLWQHFIAFLE